MRKELTEQDKNFIEENYQKLTLWKMAESLAHESTFYVQKYCSEHGLSKSKKELTKEQQRFIRDHYLQMKESEMSKELGISIFYIQKFKREEGLAKLSWNRIKTHKKVRDENLFYVEDMPDWIM